MPRFQPGQSGNPLGRPKAVLSRSVRNSRAPSRPPLSPGLLGAIVDDDKAPPAAQVAASIALLERGWGKPVQPIDADINLRATYVIRAPSAIEISRPMAAPLRCHAAGMVEPC